MESLQEEWRPVVGHEGEYDVSSQGRVRSLARTIVRKRGKPFSRGEKLLTVHVSGPGYPALRLTSGLKYVHTLVLEAFIGPRPSGYEACHCNGVRTDNRPENLRWDSPKENQNDRASHGTSNRGERCATVKLTETQAREILNSTEPGCELAKRYGVAQQTICNIRKGRRWQHLEAVA